MTWKMAFCGMFRTRWVGMGWVVVGLDCVENMMRYSFILQHIDMCFFLRCLYSGNHLLW